MTEKTYGKELIEKHVLIDNKGGAIFIFDPESVLTENENGSVSLKTESLVIDFLALLDEMGLPHEEEAAIALITVLLEKREAGEMTQYA